MDEEARAVSAKSKTRTASGATAEQGLPWADGGKRLSALRTRRGWMQAELAARCGLEQTAVSRLERGANVPQARTLAKLAKGFDLTLEQLANELGLDELAPSPGSLPPLQTEVARLMVRLAIELDQVLSRK